MRRRNAAVTANHHEEDHSFRSGTEFPRTCSYYLFLFSSLALLLWVPQYDVGLSDASVVAVVAVIAGDVPDRVGVLFRDVSRFII